MSRQVCSCGALKYQYKCPVCSSPTGVTHVTIFPPLGGQVSQLPLYPPPIIPQPLPHPLSVSTNYVLPPPPLPETTLHENTSITEQSIKYSLTFMSVCEELVEDVMEEVLPDLLRDTVNKYFEDIVHSYLSVKDETPSNLQLLPDKGGVEDNAGLVTESVRSEESMEEVCGWICGQILDDFLFVTLLEASLTEGANLVASGVTSDILEGLLFEELLEMALAL